MAARLLPLLLLLTTPNMLLAANPMESLLKKQIAEQRYQQIKAQKTKDRPPVKRATPTLQKSHKAPPYRILLISGVGEKLVAHLLTSPNVSPTIVRVGDKVDYEGRTYKVALINERCIILKRGARRYEIPFMRP